MRFLMVITIIIMSVALFALDMTTHHAQAASAPNCVSAIPSPVQGTAVPAPTEPGTIFINEVLTNPHTAWNCADQLFPPKDLSGDAWIELYNPQSQTIELTSWLFNMNDTQGNTLTFHLPSESVIAAHSFLVVFPVAYLAPNTYLIQLINATSMIDSVSIPTLLPDQSYARIPDGSSWQVSNYPTIGASNLLDPPTPTPTPTKTPKIRITRTKTPSAKRSSVSSSHISSSNSSNQSDITAGSTGSNTNASLTTNDGVQPSWHTLQFPGGTAAPSPALATVTPSSSTPQQSADTSDLPKKIIISVSVVVLAFALLWCWKHFLSP